MRRIAWLLLLLTLWAGAARAETYTVDEVRGQLVPWQQTYKTHGRTVTIDLTPTAPDVQTIPVLTVRPAFWQPEATADVAWTVQTERIAADAFSLSCKDTRPQGDLHDGEPVTACFYPPLDEDSPYARGNDLTIRRVLAKVEEVFTDIGNAHFGLDGDHLAYVDTQTAVDRQGNLLRPADMRLNLTMTLRGVSVWGHVLDAIGVRDNEYWYRPMIYVTMHDEGWYEISGRTVEKISLLHEDVPLCGWDTVKSTLEEEIEAGRIRRIDRIDLGYALCNEPGARCKPGSGWEKTVTFYAVPAWRCVCVYTSSASNKLSEETMTNPMPSQYYRTVYVNAQTGELFDPRNKSKDRGAVPEIITW